MDLELASKTEEKIFSISEYLDSLNTLLRTQIVKVKGEIGEKMYPYPGFSFFNLIDKSGSILKCFAFRKILDEVGIELEAGTEIIVTGYPEIRKERGELKFQVEKIELVGEGVLKKQFEFLKKKLLKEGYFDPKSKKPLPLFPERIGLITSEHGKGAKKDFLTRLNKFGFEILFYDVRVEGSSALTEITEAIDWFNKNSLNTDVLVLIRGGGDWESLKPFNSEEIVKAIFASKIPLITGIGHENDETLADCVADFRASTPTHVATVLAEKWEKAFTLVNRLEKSFPSFFNNFLSSARQKINFSENNLFLKTEKIISSLNNGLHNSIINLNGCFQNYFNKFKVLGKEFFSNSTVIGRALKSEQEKMKTKIKDLTLNKNKLLNRIKNSLKNEEKRLIISNPELKLRQGYSITRDNEGKIIRDLRKIKISQQIITKFYKGRTLSKIEKIEDERR